MSSEAGSTVLSIIKKHKKAKTGLEATLTELIELTNQRSPSEVAQWKDLADKADVNRKVVGPSAMDIYESKSDLQVPSKADIQIELCEEELQTKHQNGVTSWLAQGIRIEEIQ